MYFVILNHTTSNPRFLTFDDGSIANFKEHKWATLSGEAERGLETMVFEYQVVTETPRHLEKKLGKICPNCFRIFKTTEVKSGRFCCTACSWGY